MGVFQTQWLSQTHTTGKSFPPPWVGETGMLLDSEDVMSFRTRCSLSSKSSDSELFHPQPLTPCLSAPALPFDSWGHQSLSLARYRFPLLQDFESQFLPIFRSLPGPLMWNFIVQIA